MKVSVIIVNYKVRHYAGQCLMSLRRALDGIDAEVFVVDNHSADGSAEWLADKFPEATVIASNHNLGFARANNMAIRRSSGEYVLLLNPDTFVGEHTVRDVVDFMDSHRQAGAAGARMMCDDGSDAKESRRGLPTVLTALYKFCGLCARYPSSRRFGRYYMGWLPWGEPARVEVLSGAFCMLRRNALDSVGLLDEDYFMYGEDVDLSYRMLKNGYENWYVPARMLHYKGESAHRSSFRYVHVFYNAMLIFYSKHFAGRMWLVSLPVKAAIFVKAVWAFAGMQLSAAKKSLGFVTRANRMVAEYVFIGSAAALAECRGIAARRGLEARFVEGGADTLPQGHSGMAFDSSHRIYVVYDTSAYGYGDILEIFGRCVHENVRVGTYSRDTHTIITGEEVIE